jgi:hypothetical protein
MDPPSLTAPFEVDRPDNPIRSLKRRLDEADEGRGRPGREQPLQFRVLLEATRDKGGMRELRPILPIEVDAARFATNQRVPSL